MIKGQTTIVLILLVIIVFGGLGAFLLSLAQTVSQEDYMNVYTHNMLLSLMRTDTGEGGDCKYVSDAVTCAVYGMTCDTGRSCNAIADQSMDVYMGGMNEIKTTYEWYIGVYNDQEVNVGSYGDPGLLSKKTKKWTASETVYRRLGNTDQNFVVRLILARPD